MLVGFRAQAQVDRVLSLRRKPLNHVLNHELNQQPKKQLPCVVAGVKLRITE